MNNNRWKYLGLCLLGAMAASSYSQAANGDGLSEPGGPHPRLFSEPETLAGLKARAGASGSYVARTVRHCDEVTASPQTFATDSYMGFDWAQSLQSCLIAWRATGREAYARTSFVYFKALLDDLKTVGDGKGGDESARRDSGYAIRMLGPYTALAYDWLHDHPLMSDALRATARQRFKAWTDWYLASGYRARSPGSNYNAAYVYAATLIAIAEGGEAGEDGARLWRLVSGTLLQKDLLPAMERGLLRGGDWSEGWQYAPLSVASYSLALRAAQALGIDVGVARDWSRGVVLRHIHALSVDGASTYAGGDAEVETANVALRRDTLAGVIAGIATPEVKAWAQAELNKVTSSADGIVFVSALADAERIVPQAYPRDRSPTGYYAAGSATLYWRSSWKAGALWFVSPCAMAPDTDHWHPDAGNFVLARGDDNLVVDPSPYGTQSSLTSNAPTMESTVVPADYLPSQAYWGHRTGFRWAQQSPGGELVARCDYADQYRLQENDSDMSVALRDFIVLPYAEAGGAEAATVLVVDRARRRDGKGSLYLRFRSEAPLKSIGPERVAGVVGRSQLRIGTLSRTDGTVQTRTPVKGDCFSNRNTRGNCDVARYAVTEQQLVLGGAAPAAVHVLDAGGAKGEIAPLPVVLAAQGGQLWQVRRASSSWIVGSFSDTAGLQFDGPAGRVVLLPESAAGAARVNVSAQPGANGCHVTVKQAAAGAAAAAGLVVPGRPVIFDLAADCTVKATPGESFLPQGS